MKPGKVLCCRFLFAILGVDRAQVTCVHATNQQKNSDQVHAQCMSEKQKMCAVVDLPTTILASLFVALMFTGFHNQFPLLTMNSQATSGAILFIDNKRDTVKGRP